MITIEYLRHFRLFDYAIFDLVVSFLGMYLLSGILSKFFLKIRIKIPKINWVFLTLPIGIVAHLLTWTMTPMTRNFLNLDNFYILKFIILFFLLIGFKNIRFIKN